MKNTVEPSIILDISDKNTFEVFNDQQIKKVRLIYIPDVQDEDQNCRLLLTYPEFNAFSDMIRQMTVGEFEELRGMLNSIQD